MTLTSPEPICADTSYPCRHDAAAMTARLFPLFTAAAAFTVYLSTMAPSIYWGDGIEISAVCATGGIAHPTGYPLFTMLGYAACRLFPRNPAYATNLLCGLFAAAAAGVFHMFFRKMLKMFPADRFLSGWYRDIWASAGALLLAFSRTLWFHATMTEVYSLHILFSGLLGFFFVRHLMEGKRRDFLMFFGSWGLSFSNHMLSLIFAPAALVIILKSCRERRFKQAFLPMLIPGALLFMAGLLPYLYIPIRAAARPALNWGDPSNFKNFLWLVSGGDFKSQQFLMQAPGIPFTVRTFLLHFMKRLIMMAQWLSKEIFPISEHSRQLGFVIPGFLAVTAGWGIVGLIRRYKTAAMGLAGIIALGILMCLMYNIPDIEPYFLSVYPFILALALAGVLELIHAAEKAFWGRKINYLPLLLFLPALAAIPAQYKEQDKSRDLDAWHYGLNILNNTPRDAILVTFTDNDIYVLWYMREALRLRPDITIIGANFVNSGWYAAYLEKIPADGPRIRTKSEGIPTSKEAYYTDIVFQIIQPNIGRFPILLTHTDSYLERFYRIRRMGRVMPEGAYRRVTARFLPPDSLYVVEPIR